MTAGRGWFAENFEGHIPDDISPIERADYAAQLADEAEHGPADDPHDPQKVRPA